MTASARRPKKRHVLEVDGRLYYFDSFEDMQAASDEMDAAKAVTGPQRKSAKRQAVAKAKQAASVVIDPGQVQALAKSAALASEWKQAYRAREFDQLLETYRAIVEQARDEEEIEMLLSAHL